MTKTLEAYLNKKKQQNARYGYDSADIHDWTEDYRVEQQFLGFQDAQIVEFRNELEKQLEAAQKKLDDTERELSRREAKEFVNDLLDNMFSGDIKRLNNLSILS